MTCKIRLTGYSLACFLVLPLIFTACRRSYDEKVAGVEIPIPRGMNKSAGKEVELSLPILGGGQASFAGKIDANKVVEFYRKEMPARGWQPNIGLFSQGGMLTYTKDGKTVIVLVGKNDGETTLTVTVGSAKR